MINIAIDGTTSSGKSTLAGELSKRLGFKRLDTGAIYRGIACAYKRQGCGQVSATSVEKFVKNLKIEVKFEGLNQKVIACGIDETPNLRSEEISLLSSEISPFKVVREKVLALQRDFAAHYDCVVEGRDITTVVLPNADLKFFITASPEERARRRYLQFVGKPDAPKFEDVLRDLNIRDERDENREFGKLKIADDAIVIDTTGKTLEEVANLCEQTMKNKLKI